MSIELKQIGKESWFKIPDFNKMRSFFMSIVSDSNHWMFISSNGGLSAGRKNAEFALFPYYTDDKITELAHTTGNKSIFQVSKNDEVWVWEPFSEFNAHRFKISRNLYKNKFGNKVMFEEINHDLDLTFRYQWNSSNLYGFVKQSQLINHSGESRKITLLDGIQNIMPHGVSSDLQVRASNLVDAYKRNELVAESGLGIYALSAIIVDKAEPSEALKANVAWSAGLENPQYLLSSLQLDQFRNQEIVEEEQDVKGEKGAYFIIKEIELGRDAQKDWMIVANVNQDQSGVVELSQSIQEDDDLISKVNKDIERGTAKLKALVAGADGLQLSSDALKDTRHFSNTMFNIMRGGTFDHNYRIEKDDFSSYMKNANVSVYERNLSFMESLPDEFNRQQLDHQLSEMDDPDFLRLATEYLPLKFSRRHGDPSRPWNKFSINTHSEVDGSKILDYEGNWRDIFQNWEALVRSYPDFIEGMIFKFLNATTFDGYNPYRVTKGGFDWEIIEPDDPWSYIGYWGDHQIIYLLKFLEFYYDHKPEEFLDLFGKENFVFANVPYRIKSYEEIVKDPKDTIEFDEESDRIIREKVEELGADGALLGSGEQNIYHVNFLEKILATVLAKVSNFIPEGGIWMNTQRPEWNDANNALVGNGVSMVTLYYLRRFLNFFEPILAKTDLEEIAVSEEMAELFSGINQVLNSNKGILDGQIDNTVRKKITDGLGQAGSDYRDKIYDQGFSGKKKAIGFSDLKEFVSTALEYLEHSIDANRRTDDLYHSYNLMSVEDDGISVSYLDEMLEGQVAVLSSKYLNSEEANKVLDALRNSALYRKDQQSYILYPNKDLQGFLEKNNIPENSVKKSELLKKLLSAGDHRIINQDVEGNYHFNGNFKNAADLRKALKGLSSGEYSTLVEKEEKLILRIFEEVFNHKAFTGRSGTFFAYEGLGSIYWHMVSKLHLAVFEVHEQARKEDADDNILSKIEIHFDEIGKGIGVHKDPELYGAFPTDPYSHTPYHRGAQQPGMTGQVKEDILVRFGELGISIEDGCLVFNPGLLKKSEFRTQAGTFNYVDVLQEPKELNLPEDSLTFTCCQVPVIYQSSDKSGLDVIYTDGSVKNFEGNKLDHDTTDQLLTRSGKIEKMVVFISRDHLR
ncbi:hypothetical protein AB2B38_004160 [Balneola sp. MJW-20]|uniref:hypothetical protein n=1 Tax=Gracilimonas aurantiaca TaxID=3234185 RepID=UPI0034668923